MRTYCFIIVAVLVAACGGKSAYINKVEQDQVRRNAVFINPEQSPLDTSEIKTFQGLHFYAPDEAYSLKGIITWLPQVGYIDMPHTNGSALPYMQTAVIDFELQGQHLQLPAYQTEAMRSKRILFVPFTDPTNGSETYEGGRYLDLPYVDRKAEIDIDFNFAYIPFCKHSAKFVCPKVPEANHIPIAIQAGERL